VAPFPLDLNWGAADSLYLVLAIVSIALHRKILVVEGANVFRVYYASDTRADALLIGFLVGLFSFVNIASS
jgi:hypothetical protein